MATASEKLKRKSIRDYFEDPGAVMAWALILLGIPALALFAVGLLMIGAGVYMLWRKKSLTSDQQIDAWIAEDYGRHDFVARARQLAALGKEERDPVVLTGGASEELKQNVFSGERWGDDGSFRETPMSAAVILCSADQIAIYRTGIDLTTGNRVNERVYEAFYQDVVSINIASSTSSMNLDKTEAQASFWGKLNATDIQKGLTKAKVKMNLNGIRTRHADQLINNVFQSERARVYRIRLCNGEEIVLPIGDGRPTRVANASDDQSLGETARGMFALRAFVRDKKRQLLAEMASGGGPLI